MFLILKMFFIFIVIVLVLGLLFVVGFVLNVYSLFRRNNSNTGKKAGGFGSDEHGGSQHSGADYRQGTSGQPTRHSKIIPEDEGEYVDFEEMK